MAAKKRKTREFLTNNGKGYQAIFENAGAGIALFNIHNGNQIISANSLFHNILGFEKNELEGKGLLEITHEDDRRETKKRCNELLDGKQKNIQWKMRYLHRDGSYIWANTAYSLILDKEDNPSVIVVVATDITDKVIADKEIRSLQKSLANISSRQQIQWGRDLFDSVNQRMAGLSFLMKKFQKQFSYVDPIHELNMERMIQEIKQVMKQVKTIAKGLAPLYLSNGDFISAVKYLCSNINDIDGIACEFHNNSQIPAFDPETINQLYSIVQEALSNAAVHSEADSIKVELHYTKDDFLITIVDNGKGMIPLKKSKKGVGIKMMQYRADLIDADLDFESIPGEGTTVSCRLNAK